MVDLKDKHIYFLDAMGKWNIHRYMNLFSGLGIKHSVLMDSDKDNGIHKYLNEFLGKNNNSFTTNTHNFPVDLECFLGIDKPKRKDLKPLNVLYNCKNGSIPDDKINSLRKIIDKLVI